MAKQHPSAEMIKDLAKIFAKHNWSGQPIGILASPPEADAPAFRADDDGCPDGKTARWVTYKRPDGSWGMKKICV